MAMTQVQNQAPSSLALVCDDVLACMAQDIVNVPASLYSIRRRNLPLSEAQAKADFAPNIQFFAGNRSDEGDSTNTIITNAPDQPFLMKSVSPYVAVEPQGFSANGEAIPIPAASGPTPSFDGIVRQVNGALNPNVQAWLEWGQCTWRAASNYFNAYRFTMPLGGRFVLFSELASDIGTLDSHNEWSGFSDSLVGLPEFVRDVNDRMRELACGDCVDGKVFVPATVQNIACCGETAVLDGVPTPMVKASWGGPRMEGLWGGCYPAPGLVLQCGVPIYLNAVVDPGAQIYYDALLKSVQNINTFTYDENFTGLVAGSATAEAQFYKFIGGKLSTGVTIRGANLTPRAVIEWYAMCSGVFGGLFSTVQQRDGINQLAGFLPDRIKEGLDGKPITDHKKSDLLKLLAGAYHEKHNNAKTMFRLAGVPGIDADGPQLPGIGKFALGASRKPKAGCALG